MRGLAVLYDRHCPLCRRLQAWLVERPTYFPLEFIPAGSLEAEARWPRLDPLQTLGELTAIDDEGGVYRGEEAYLVILYAFVDYRGWAFWLARGERRLLRQGVRVLGWVRGSGRCGGACSVAPQSR